MAWGAFLRRQPMEFDVDESLSRGFLRRSMSFPPYKANEAFSRLLYSRESLAEIPPPLPPTQDDEISSLKKLVKSLHKKSEGLQEKNEDLQEKNEDLQEKNEGLQKKDKDLQEKHEDLQEKYDALICKAELRQILSNFLKKYNVDKSLMDKAREMYPKEFPGETTFKGTIRKLLEESQLPNEATKHKLNCLRKAAKSFRSLSLSWWDEKMGDQFYILCFKVAQWNKSTFHPEIKGVTKCICRIKAHKGLFTYDGVDCGPLVMELLHAT